MFEPEAADYFTYSMVFWLPLDTDVSRKKLQKDLETYFDGLAAEAVPGLNRDNARTKVAQLFDSLATRYSVPEKHFRSNVELEPVAGDAKWEKSYDGNIHIYEGIIAHENIKLNTKVRLQKCQIAGYQVIFLEVSPQSYSHQLWIPLDEMARQWHCPEE